MNFLNFARLRGWTGAAGRSSLRLLGCLSCLALLVATLPMVASAQETMPPQTQAQTQALPQPAEPPVVIENPEALGQGDPLLVWIWSDAPLFHGTASLVNEDSREVAAGGFFFLPTDEPGCLYGALLPVPVQAKTGAATIVLEWDREIIQGAGATQPGDAAQPPGATQLVGTAQPADAAPGPGTDAAATAALAPDTAAPPAIAHVRAERSLTITKTTFTHETIPLDKANTLLRIQEDPAKTAESISFAAVFAVKDSLALFPEERMIRPLSGEWRQTAGFGDVRLYRYYNGGSDTSIHGGIDLGVKSGTNVRACLPGNVVFAKARIVTGNTVVLEHLPGLFSIYMHLSKISVEEGQKVEAGEAIGLSGSTGLSTGPHLHWEIRIGGTSVNPYYWLEHSLLDKESISGKIIPLIEGR